MRIGDCQFDPVRYELTRAGEPIRLERIPMDLLLLLVERRGEIVTRDQIVARLWGKDAFLDVDNSINTAIRKLRRAFGDDPANPAFIKTRPGRGYELVARVEEPVAPPGGTRARVMLAVLPFDTLSGLEADRGDYFADGLTEEAICALGQLDPSRLGVIARTSSMAYKGSSKPAAEIGRQLGVDYLLESTVRQQDQRVRVSVQLIRVRDQVHVWAERYDRDATNFLGVQDELGRAIAGAVGGRLLPDGPAMRRVHTADPRAYDLYLRGRHQWNQLTPLAILRGTGYFEQALALDDGYALAHAGLAEGFAMLAITADTPALELHPRALTAARRALELDPSLAEAHASLAAIKLWMEWDWAGVEAAARRALECNPSYVHAYRWYAVMLAAVGRHEEAAHQMTQARTLDPLSPLMTGLTGGLLTLARRHAEALEHLRRALAMNDSLWVLHLWTGKALEGLGQMAEARACYDAACERSGGNTEPVALRAALAGPDEVRRTLGLLEQRSAAEYVPPSNVAYLNVALGEEREALEWLERAWKVRDARLVWLAADAKWDSIRDKPRFQALLRRMGLPDGPLPAL